MEGLVSDSKGVTALHCMGVGVGISTLCYKKRFSL